MERIVEARVTGRVQGVWFRAWTRGEAQALGLRGWVRNEPDGSVLARIAGPAAQVDAMLSALREGPERAAVTAVEVRDLDDDPGPGFRIDR